MNESEIKSSYVNHEYPGQALMNSVFAATALLCTPESY